MAKREVELVIKARDQAKSNVEGIVKSLADLVEQQGALGKSSGTANTALGKLATAFKNLQVNAAGLSALGRLQSNLDRTTASVQRMEAAFGQTQENLKGAQQAASASALSLVELQTAANQAGNALKQEQGTLATVRAEQERLSEQVSRAEANYRKLTAAIKPNEASFSESNKAAAAAGATLQSLIVQQNAQVAAVEKQRTAVRIASQAFNTLTSEAARAEQQVTKINGTLTNLAQGAEAEATAVKDAQVALGEFRDTAAQAAASLGGVELRQEAIKGSSEEVAAAIQKVSAALLLQQEAQRQAASATGTAGTTATQTAFRAQQEAVDAARLAFRGAVDDLNRLKQAFADAETPTAAMTAELEAARVAAVATGSIFKEQVAALERIAEATRQAAIAEKQKATEDAFLASIADQQVAALNQVAEAERRTVIAAQLLGRESHTVEAALQSMGAAGSTAAVGVGKFEDQSRRALSLVQRLRGEILALTTQFVGLYAAITQIGGVIEAIRKVEAAGSRLNVVFSGDKDAVREQLRLLSQEASTLGLNFGVLSDQFSKFAVATDAANFSIEATREIFKDVAVAARVNKLSVEDLEGVYLALEQMVSKGKVTMEELRRQLGNRLPGAFNILADALGVSTVQLNKMISAGQVLSNQETLLKFAQELERRFGPSLANALTTVTTQLDKFSNNIFEAQQRIAAGGFSDALKESLIELNAEFESRAGRDFFLELGALLGNLVKALTFVISNFGLLVSVFQVFVSVKVGGFLLSLIANMRAAGAVAEIGAKQFFLMDAASQKLIVTQAAAADAVGAFGLSLNLVATRAVTLIRVLGVARVSSAATAVAIAELRGAVTALGVSLGALALELLPITLISGAILLLTGAFGSFATVVPDASEALDEHNRIMKAYTAEADNAEAATRKFNKALIDVSVFEARGNLEKLKDSLKAAREEAAATAQALIDAFKQQNSSGSVLAGTDTGPTEDSPIIKNLRALTEQMQNGEITVFEFRGKLKDLFETIEGDRAMSGLVARLGLTGDKAREVEVALGEGLGVLETLGDKTEGLNGVLKRLGETYDQATKKVHQLTSAQKEQEAQAARGQAAIETLQGFIPQFAENQKNAARRKNLEDAKTEAIKDAKTTADKIKALAVAKIATAELAKTEAKEQAALDKKPKATPQAELNKELQKTIDLRNFEAAQVERSFRDQAIAKGIFDAIEAAKQKDLKATFAQIAAAGLAAAKAFDAQEAQRVGNLQAADQAKLQAKENDRINIDAQSQEDAIKEKIDLTTTYGQEWEKVHKKLLQHNRDVEDAKKAVEDVVALEKERQDALSEFNRADAAGELSADERKARLADLDAMRVKIEQMRQDALVLAEALGDEKLIAALKKVNTDFSDSALKAAEFKKQILDIFGNDISSGIDGIAKSIGDVINGTTKWKDAISSIGDQFLATAGQILQEIAQLIIKMLIFNALKDAGLGNVVGDNILGAIGESLGIPAKKKHGGGIAGEGRTVMIDPRWFRGAKKFHNGGLPGLKQDEVASVLRKGEEVLTETDPRHTRNGGQGGGGTKIVNLFNGVEFLSQALQSSEGQKVILNLVRKNPTKFKSALGGVS